MRKLIPVLLILGLAGCPSSLLQVDDTVPMEHPAKAVVEGP